MRIEKYQDRIWFCIVVNILVLAAFLVIFRPVFETNDDVAIALFVNGSNGASDAHLVYSHYFVGAVLSGLYRVSASIPWYALMQYAVLFSALTAVTFVTVNRLKNPSAPWIALIILLFFAYEGYVKLQYTKTAGIVSSAGILLLFFSAEQSRIRWKPLLCGYCLACLGFMYRKDPFLVALALMTGIGAFLVFDSCEIRQGRFGRYFLKLAGIFGLLLVLIAGLYLADRFSYRSSKWQEYIEYNELRTELFDYGFPDFEVNKKAYRKLGINKNAYGIYRGWNYMDTEKFTPDVMRELIALKEPGKFNRELLVRFLKDVPPNFVTIPCFYCFLLILIYGLFWSRRAGNTVLAVVWEIILLGTVYLYLYYQGRYLINRVDVGIWFAATLVILWTYSAEKCRLTNQTGAVLFLSVCCILQNTWRKDWRVNTTEKRQQMQQERAVIETIHNDSEHLYLVKTGTISFAKSYGVFDAVPYGMAQNILALGGWPAYTPGYREKMEIYGITNPFRDMIRDEHIYLVDKDIDSTMKYINTYYDETAQAILVTEIGNYPVYQICAD